MFLGMVLLVLAAMESLIYALVDAESEQAALASARVTFDRVVEKCGFPVGCFTEYELFTRPGRERLSERWGEMPQAAPAHSERGQALIEEGWRQTRENFAMNLEEVRSILSMYTDEEIMENEDNVRNTFLRIGTFVGESVPLYQERGRAVRDRSTLNTCLEEFTSPWVVPAEGRA